MRSFLTMLGIIIGTCSVIVMSSIGDATSSNIKSKISGLGSNLLILTPQRGLGVDGKSISKNFTIDELKAIKLAMPMANAITANARTQSLAQFGGNNTQPEVRAIDPSFFQAISWDIALGSPFTQEDYRIGNSVCILGESTYRDLFGDKFAIGKKIRVKDSICQIVGILSPKGQSSYGSDQDSLILMPFKTYNRLIFKSDTSSNISSITISLKDTFPTAEAINIVTKTLRQIRHIPPTQKDSFYIRSTQEIEEMLNQTMNRLKIFIIAIASISLLVGGIGIMNVMLVSVTERTKEIGIRLSIGALEHEVLIQFLIEAMVISSIGGLLGIGIGFIASFLSVYFMGLPFIFSIDVVIISFLFSTFMGVLFGYLPARRASKLNPIDALRYE